MRKVFHSFFVIAAGAILVLLGSKLIKKQSGNDLRTPKNENYVDSSVSTANQSSSGIKPSVLNLRFRDVSTGYFIIPDHVRIQQRENKNVERLVFNNDISENGTVVIPLENGTYDIAVMAQGYNPMSSFFKLTDQSLNVNFNLESISQVMELRPEYVQSKQRVDGMFITGFIVDDFTGKPLADVRIFSKDKRYSTFSDLKGFFQLIVKLPENEDLKSDRGKLIFEKHNYTTELKQNFDMWPDGDLILQIRMKKGSGINEENIIQNRPPSIAIKQ